MKANIPVLNIIISLLYIVFGFVAAFLLKRSLQPQQKRREGSSLSSSQQSSSIPKLFIVSFLKKYTLPGSLFCAADKKYLLKEVVILSIYGAACLKINHIVLWPCAIVVPAIFILALALEWMPKTNRKGSVQDYRKGATQNQVPPRISQNMQANIIQCIQPQPQPVSRINPISSEPQIESVQVIVYTIPTNNKNRYSKNPNQKNEHVSESRPMLQQLALSLMALLSTLLISHTILTLLTSISNSGQLNITSVCIILLIDQIGVRLALGGISFGVLSMITRATQLQIQNSEILMSFISEQLQAKLKRQKEEEQQLQAKRKERQKKQEINADLDHESDVQTRGKQNVQEFPQIQPEPLLFVSPTKNNLNIINMLQQQRTKRQHDPSQDDIDNIYLTTAEKEIFSNDGDQRQEGTDTKRRKLKDKDCSHLSAMTLGLGGAALGANNNDDMVLLKNPVLGQLQINLQGTYGALLMSPGGQTRRKRGGQFYRKKNKRNLHLTGSSPYLQYLPDMLKNVEKGRKEQASKKVL